MSRNRDIDNRTVVAKTPQTGTDIRTDLTHALDSSAWENPQTPASVIANLNAHLGQAPPNKWQQQPDGAALRTAIDTAEGNVNWRTRRTGAQYIALLTAFLGTPEWLHPTFQESLYALSFGGADGIQADVEKTLALEYSPDYLHNDPQVTVQNNRIQFAQDSLVVFAAEMKLSMRNATAAPHGYGGSRYFLDVYIKHHHAINNRDIVVNRHTIYLRGTENTETPNPADPLNPDRGVNVARCYWTTYHFVGLVKAGDWVSFHIKRNVDQNQQYYSPSRGHTKIRVTYGFLEMLRVRANIQLGIESINPITRTIEDTVAGNTVTLVSGQSAAELSATTDTTGNIINIIDDDNLSGVQRAITAINGQVITFDGDPIGTEYTRAQNARITTAPVRLGSLGANLQVHDMAAHPIGGVPHIFVLHGATSQQPTLRAYNLDSNTFIGSPNVTVFRDATDAVIPLTGNPNSPFHTARDTMFSYNGRIYFIDHGNKIFSFNNTGPSGAFTQVVGHGDAAGRLERAPGDSSYDFDHFTIRASAIVSGVIYVIAHSTDSADATGDKMYALAPDSDGHPRYLKKIGDLGIGVTPPLSPLRNLFTAAGHKGKIYAMERVGNANRLFEIDRVTAHATQVGTTTYTTGWNSMTGIEDYSVKNGLYGMANNTTHMYRIK